MRAIDADALKEDLTRFYDNEVTARKLIDEQPTIQPKKGTWIDTGGNAEWYAREYRCSECGDTMLGEANFCPNCGADMREVTT